MESASLTMGLSSPSPGDKYRWVSTVEPVSLTTTTLGALSYEREPHTMCNAAIVSPKPE
jgi:hypothetical protein